MRPVARRVVLLCAFAAACATGSVLCPVRFAELPWSERPADRAVLGARARFDRGDEKGALAEVGSVLGSEPRHVDALRLRQDILRGRGRRGLLLAEVEGMLAHDSKDALAHYLHGRIAYGDDARQKCFERAAELAPDALWPWLGLAYALRATAPARAEALYARLLDVTDGHPLVAVPYAQLRRGPEHAEELLALYRRLAEDPRVPGAGALGIADVAIVQGDRELAFASLLAGMRLRPFDPIAQGLVRGWLQAGASQDQAGQMFDVMRSDPARAAAFARGEGAVVFAELLERHRQPIAAIQLLERIGVGARMPGMRRLQRRLYAGIGDAEAVMRLLAADLPRALLFAEPNELRGVWHVLLDGPWIHSDPFSDGGRAEAFLRALVAAGFLAEVDPLSTAALRRWPHQDGIRDLGDEVRRELVFEDGLRRLLYEGYREGAGAPLARIVERLRRLSVDTFGRDVVGIPVVFHVPLVGELLDPFAGGLAEHLHRYNRHLVLGRRAGGVPEGMLLSRLSVCELPPQPGLDLVGRCREVVTMDREVRSLSGVLGGDIAGVALLNHYMVDFDAVRDWAYGIAERRRVTAEDGGASLADPFPRDPGFDPLDASHRLQVLSPVQDADLEAAVLDTIRHHERQHLVDSFRFLPIERHLLAGLGILLRFGVSPSAIEAEMEMRAELASLAMTPHTEISLAHIADFLNDPGTQSPHHVGFTNLARLLVARLEGLGVSHEHAVPSRWSTLDLAVVRQAARELLAEL